MSRTAIILLVALAALCTCACIEPPSPSAFYRPPDPLPAGPPGTILRQDALSHVPNGARGWRILYLSSDPSGRPIAVSGVIFAPLGDPPPGGRPVVAWAHPTTGVASRCAPSLRPRSLLRTIAGLKPLLAQGYVVVATDYPGLGTPGPHPYLIGQSEARSVLDSVRAARLLPEAGAGDRFALWGHSQGGHASLWSGQIAAAYVPDLRLVGVAAAAPATQFTESFGLDLGTLKGKVFASMAFTAWSKLFAGASLDRIATRSAVPVMEALGRGCIETTGEALLEAAGGVLLEASFLKVDPVTTEPWKGILVENSPAGTESGVPLLITQGEADTVVHPDITAGFACRACRAGTSVALRLYPGVDHTNIGYDSADDVAAWIADRFAGRPAQSECNRLP